MDDGQFVAICLVLQTFDYLMALNATGLIVTFT